MNEKTNMLSRKSKRIPTMVACTAMVMMLGAIPAYAQGDTGTQPQKALNTTSVSAGIAGEIEAADLKSVTICMDTEAGICLIQSQDGKVRHSYDNGDTWVEGMPEGVDVNLELEEGEHVFMAVSKTEESLEQMMLKKEDGKVYHSTDDGNTWVEGIPGNADMISYELGEEGPSQTVSLHWEDGNILIKNEDGKLFYSEDEGVTWLEGTPEGFDASVFEHQPSFSPVIPEAGIATETKALAVRSENGEFSYSEDNGETWIQGLPEGVELQTAEGDVLITAAKSIAP